MGSCLRPRYLGGGGHSFTTGFLVLFMFKLYLVLPFLGICSYSNTLFKLYSVIVIVCSFLLLYLE